MIYKEERLSHSFQDVQEGLGIRIWSSLSCCGEGVFSPAPGGIAQAAYFQIEQVSNCVSSLLLLLFLPVPFFLPKKTGSYYDEA